MRRRAARSTLALALTLALVSPGVRAEEPGRVAPTTCDLTRRVAVELTTGHLFYQPEGPRTQAWGHAATLRETRELDLPAGRSSIEWIDLPDTMRPETLLVAVEGAGVKLVAQRFEETAPGRVGLEALLRGQPVRARPRADAEHPARKLPEWSGAIVSLEGGVVLRVGKELTVLPPAELTLSGAGKGAARRALLVELEATTPVKARVAVTAVVERVEPHLPAYTLVLDRPAHKARLVGHVLLANGSGHPLDDARLFFAPEVNAPWNDGGRSGGAINSGSTWLVDPHRPPPYPLPEPVRFGPTGLADVPLVASEAPLTERTTATWSNLDELRDKPEEPLHLQIRQTWELDPTPLALPGPLPQGGVFVAEPAPSGGAPQTLGQALLYQRSPGPITIAAQGAWLPQLESRRVAVQVLGACATVVKWEHTIPAEALEHAPFELELPFTKARVEAQVGKAEGVTVEQSAEASKVVVRAVARPGAAPREPRKIVVTYKTNRCK